MGTMQKITIQKTPLGAQKKVAEKAAMVFVMKLEKDAWLSKKSEHRLPGLLNAAHAALRYGKTLDSPTLLSEARMLAKEYIEKAKPTDSERLRIACEFDLGYAETQKYSAHVSAWNRFHLQDTYQL